MLVPFVGVSPDSASAVGYTYTNPAPSTTLVEHWNGTTWSIVHSPNPMGSTGSVLYSTSCVTSTCTAVGYWSTVGLSRTLVEKR